MMKVLVILHDPSEGPGTLEDYLAFKRVAVHKVRLYAYESLPQSVESYDAVVSMGGPMNVNEDEQYPFLRDETGFLKQAIDLGLPVLGICLGAQMIARSCGASVYKAPNQEIGWNQVLLTDAGKDDMFFHNLPEELTVFQWHNDTFDLPEGGQLLATSAGCLHQAFRYHNAYGLQFHVEVTPQIFSDWFGLSPEGEGFIHHLRKIEVAFIRQALRLYSNFFKLMKVNWLSQSSCVALQGEVDTT